MSSTSSPTFRKASIRAYHSTGSFSTLAMIWSGDNSDASGPVLLFRSPGGANGRRTLSRYPASAIATAPTRILSQSSSVLGIVSSMPLAVVVVLTDSKILSAIGSIRSRISSFTDTMGFISPQSPGARNSGDPFEDNAGFVDDDDWSAGVADWLDEQAEANAPTIDTRAESVVSLKRLMRDVRPSESLLCMTSF